MFAKSTFRMTYMEVCNPYTTLWRKLDSSPNANLRSNGRVPVTQELNLVGSLGRIVERYPVRQESMPSVTISCDAVTDYVLLTSSIPAARLACRPSGRRVK